MIVEIYTAIASRAAGIRKGLSKVREPASLDAVLGALGSDGHRALERYDDHSTDAILTTAQLRGASKDSRFWNPIALTPALAETEGWTFGVL